MDWISILYITVVTFGVVALELGKSVVSYGSLLYLLFLHKITDGPRAGLAILNAMSLTSWFQWGVRYRK